uniref:ACOX domain-containing protein n=1 Tax=Elaeophora elaphi TaxID=1147741 RepID=A0A0R3RSH9_9BILA
MLSREIQILSCAAKVLSTEEGVKALDDARLACGAYGFLKSSRLNDLRDAFDPSRTFEGDNNILMQQVTYALISLSEEESSQDWNDSPLQSLVFLANKPQKFSTWKDDPLEDIANAYIWLLHFLISEVKEDIKDKVNSNCDKRQAKLEAQGEKCKMITYAYCELTILNCFRESLPTAPTFLRKILRRLAAVYAYNSIDKHIATFYIGGYCIGKQWGSTVKKRRRESEAAILPDAISVCDAFAPPDFLLHSILSSSDGQIYQNLIQYFMQFSRSIN